MKFKRELFVNLTRLLGKAGAVAAIALLTVDCGATIQLPAPAPPPQADRSAEFRETCTAIWDEELARPIEPEALTACVARAVAGATGEDIRAGVRASTEYQDRQAAIAAKAAADAETAKRPNAGEQGRVHVDGLVFRRDDGSIFPWRGATDFLLFKRFLDGEDIDAVLTQRIKAGANLVRVLGMVDSFAHLYPQEHADYYARLAAFVDACAARGLRVEFVVFADAQIIMPALDAERSHIERVGDVLAGKWNVFVEGVNEPLGDDKNIPGDGSRAYALGRLIQGRGFPVASGQYDVADCSPTLPHLDYVTPHTERKPDWPRTARALAEVRDGFGWGTNCTTTRFDGVHVPVVGDEPMGFGEVETGSRSVSADDAAYYAATCGLMGAGCTFHATDGVTSTLWGPVQTTAAAAFFAALTWVPPEAQLAPYMRGGTEPGCHWVGESIAEHDDALELRSFAKVVNGSAWLVQIRTTRSQVAPCGAWTVAETPRLGLARLAR